MEKKKAIIICSTVIAGVVLCLSVLFALRSISDYIQDKKENEENIELTQTYCDAISGDYNNWILSDTELQEIDDLIKEKEAEEARRRAAARQQQPVQQEQIYVQEAPVEDQIDYSASDEWVAARDAAHSSMDGGKAGGTESYFGAHLTMN